MRIFRFISGISRVSVSFVSLTWYNTVVSIFDGALGLSVTAASGIEAVTKKELIDLGYAPGGAEFGRISFDGTFRDAARCNIFLRTADRVYINICKFRAESFDELFDGVSKVKWRDSIPADGKVLVNARSRGSKLFALSAIQRVAKKAIALAYPAGLTETGETYSVDVVIINDEVTLALDITGNALHKRGYRTYVGEAPLKETLAAAMILLSGWKPEYPFADPFCGSGTLPIEAALIATNTAPGLNRSFVSEAFRFAPEVYAGVREEARDLIKQDAKPRISGFDVNPEAVRLALRHAENAGIRDKIHIQAADMRSFSSRFARGHIVTNPPYGERLMRGKELDVLYRDFAKVYFSLDDWRLAVITSYYAFERAFGAKAKKRRKLYNAELEATLYFY